MRPRGSATRFSTALGRVLRWKDRTMATETMER